MEVKDGAFYLRERAPGVSVEEIRERLPARWFVEGDIPEMQF